MWERLPIQQTGQSGRTYSSIVPHVEYRRYSEVLIKPWKRVPYGIKEWAFSIWKEEFGCIRCPLSPEDLFAWIPGTATLVARHGRWIGSSASREINYILCNVVVSTERGKGIAQRMIESICYETCKVWGDRQAFFFELERVPQSLSNASVFQKFRYAWFPHQQTTYTWKRMRYSEVKTYLEKEKGFHPRKYAGYIGYKTIDADVDEWCILDAYNDVVVCSTYSALSHFNRSNSSGVYARIPSSYGNVSLFAENMYFDKEPLDVLLLA
jgi:hypothetical protein